MIAVNKDNLENIISEEAKKANHYWQIQSKKYPRQAELYKFYAKLDEIEIKYVNTFRAGCDDIEIEDVKHLALEAVNNLTADFMDSSLYEEYEEEWEDAIEMARTHFEKEEAAALDGESSSKVFTADAAHGLDYLN